MPFQPVAGRAPRAFQSTKEAVANAQIVIAEWIETASSLNRPIPAPKGKLSYA